MKPNDVAAAASAAVPDSDPLDPPTPPAPASAVATEEGTSLLGADKAEAVSKAAAEGAADAAKSAAAAAASAASASPSGGAPRVKKAAAAAAAAAGAGSGSGASGSPRPADANKGGHSAALQAAYAAVLPYVSWEKPVQSGAALGAVVVFYTVFFILDVSFASFFLFTAVLALAGAGAAVLVRPYYPLPFPPRPSGADYSGHTDVVADAVRSGMTLALNEYTYFRHLMLWENFYASTRALAILYLLANNTWMFCPCTIFIATLALFAIPALHQRHVAAVDNVLAAAKPHVQKVAAVAASARAALNRQKALLAFGLGFALLWFMNVVSLCTWLLLSAWTFVLLDVLPTLQARAKAA